MEHGTPREPSAAPTPAAHRAAVMYTLIEFAKLADVDPKAWLADVLARIADYPAQQIDALLPWSWRATRDRQTTQQTA
jgi:transposase